MPRPVQIAASAAPASRYASLLSEAADRIDPYIPLAAYHEPLRRAAAAVSADGDCLYYLARMTADTLRAAGDDGAERAGRWLAEAAARAGRASDTVTRAADNVRRDLRKAGTEPGQAAGDAELFTRRAHQTWDCLIALKGDLEKAAVADVTGALPALAALAEVTMHLTLAATFLSQSAERFSYGLAEAYERHPARPVGRARAAGEVRTVAAMMQRTAADTRRAHRVLAAAAEQARAAAWKSPAGSGR